MQSSDKSLCSKRNGGGRVLKSFKEACDETKARLSWYMAAAKNEWISATWRNETLKEQLSLKKEAEEAMGEVVEKTV